MPDSRLPQFDVGAPDKFTVPVIKEFESQNRSGVLPPTSVRELPGCTSIVDWLATTTPPCKLAAMLDPASVACESLVTIKPCPLLPDTIRLAPASRTESFVTKTAPVVPP